MPDLVIRTFGGKPRYSIEFFKPSNGAGRGEYLDKELERIAITNEQAAMGLDLLAATHQAGHDVRELKPEPPAWVRPAIEAMG